VQRRTFSRRRDAYLAGTEFAHLHGAHDGSLHSLHAALPREAVALAVDRGWGELHPIARTGARAPTLMMLYSPRDETELQAIWKLVEISYQFARGAWAAPVRVQGAV
jgi:hypothetical protein